MTPTDPPRTDLPPADPIGTDPLPAGPSTDPPSTGPARTAPPRTDPALDRWRLILGRAAETSLGGFGDPRTAGRDAALDWLYGRDPDAAGRGVRRGGPAGPSGSGDGGDGRYGGDGPSIVTTVDWLDQINTLFPKETVERLERDAVERYQIDDLVTDPDVLARIEPNEALLRAVLRTKHLMNPALLAQARRIVAAVVEQLLAKLSTEIRQTWSGTRSRKPSQFRQHRNFDIKRTLRGNLAHYDPREGKIYLQTPHFTSRTQRHLDKWQVVLIVDQSGSMVGSVIHAAVTASCLWSLPGVRTHLIAFDTAVVDLTSDVDDPVELLMKVQLGGGTDIAGAVKYGSGLIDNPRRAIVVLITDFFEGGHRGRLVRQVGDLVAQGTKVLGLAALDEEANPVYDQVMAQKLVDVGAHVGAMTPGGLAAFIADVIG